MGFMVSHAFQLNWVKADEVVNQFKLNILMLILSQIPVMKGNNCCFTDSVKKDFNVGMHSDVYERIWVIGMMMDTADSTCWC